MNLKEEILDRTNRGLEIFYFYMPIDFVPKRNFRNPLYEDKHASCNIYLDSKAHCYRMKDFGNEIYSGDCFWFAATTLGFDVRTEFPKVLATIIQDLHLGLTPSIATNNADEPNSQRNMNSSLKKVSPSAQKLPDLKKWFVLYEQPFQVEELTFGHVME